MPTYRTIASTLAIAVAFALPTLAQAKTPALLAAIAHKTNSTQRLHDCAVSAAPVSRCNGAVNNSMAFSNQVLHAIESAVLAARSSDCNGAVKRFARYYTSARNAYLILFRAPTSSNLIGYEVAQGTVDDTLRFVLDYC